MWKLGLTGSVATGKSTVLKAFADLGVPVFSADDAVHELYRGEAVPAIEQLFPGVSHRGEIDRRELSRRLLAAPERLKELESLVHPLVRQRVGQFLTEVASTGAALAVVEIPLLFEAGFEAGLDRIVVATAEPGTIRKRALDRPGMTVEKLDAILARQLPEDEKRKRADYLISSENAVEAVRATVKALVDSLRANPKD